MSKTNSKNNSVQALRAIAFIGILTFHCGFGVLGTWGVSVFFVLSGFLMMYTSLVNNKPMPQSFVESLRFAKKKIFALYHLHILIIIAQTVYLLYYNIENLSIEFAKDLGIKLLLNILLIQSYFPSADIYFSINGVAWYLSSAGFTYFSFPSLYRFVKTLSKRSMVIMASIVVAILFIVPLLANILFDSSNFTDWLVYICPFMRCGDFFIGCILGRFYLEFKSEGKESKSLYFTAVEVVVVLLAVFANIIYDSNIIPQQYAFIKRDLLFLPISCLIVYIFVCGKGAITKVLNNKLFIKIGDFSPYGFLIHPLAILISKIVLYKVFCFDKNTLVLSIVSFMITIILCVAYLETQKIYKKTKTRKLKYESQ